MGCQLHCFPTVVKFQLISSSPVYIGCRKNVVWTNFLSAPFPKWLNKTPRRTNAWCKTVQHHMFIDRETFAKGWKKKKERREKKLFGGELNPGRPRAEMTGGNTDHYTTKDRIEWFRLYELICSDRYQGAPNGSPWFFFHSSPHEPIFLLLGSYAWSWSYSWVIALCMNLFCRHLPISMKNGKNKWNCSRTQTTPLEMGTKISKSCKTLWLVHICLPKYSNSLTKITSVKVLIPAVRNQSIAEEFYVPQIIP